MRVTVVDLDNMILEEDKRQRESDLMDRVFLRLVSLHLEEYNSIVDELVDTVLHKEATTSLEGFMKAHPDAVRGFTKEKLEEGWEQSAKEFRKDLEESRNHIKRDLEWAVWAQEEYSYFLQGIPKEKHIHQKEDAHKRRG